MGGWEGCSPATLRRTLAPALAWDGPTSLLGSPSLPVQRVGASRASSRGMPAARRLLPPACAPVWSCRTLMEYLPSRQLPLPRTLTERGE